MSIDFKRSILPHLAVVIVFLALTIVFFMPLFQGKEMQQGDIMQFKGASKEIVDHREATGEEALWTNSMFSGMPAFQISVLYTKNLVKYINTVFTVGLPAQAGLFFLYLLGFYILMIALRVNPWLGLAGSIAFAFSSYFLIIFEAGHNTKAHAIGYMAPVVAGVVMTYRGKLLLGFMLTALFLSLELLANHLQITYYLAMFLAAYFIVELIAAVRENRLAYFGKATAFLGIAAIIAVGTNAGNFLTTLDYAKYTTRGKSELTIKPSGTPNDDIKTSGLDRDYIVQYSYGVSESMSLLIPNFKGGGNGSFDKDVLEKVDPQKREAVAGMDRYWGDQSIISGPVYVGAIVMFLAVLGLFVIRGPIKWALFIMTVLSVMLAWGKNFMPLTNLFLDYFPAYNKFRAVSMILVIAEFTIPLLAVLCLNEIIKNRDLLKEKISLFGSQVEKKKLFFAALAFTAGICLFFFLAPGSTQLEGTNEAAEFTYRVKQSQPEVTDAQIASYLDNIMPEVIEARKAMLKSDAGRSLIFILVAAGLVWFYHRSKMDSRLFIGAIALLVLIDLWSVDARYLHKEKYVSKRQNAMVQPKTAANEYILKDRDPHYRVLNIAVNTFNNATTSYYHKSIGGYHGAKLKRYQEMIEFYLAGDINSIYNTLGAAPTDSAIQATFAQQGTLNMLNTKYIIYNPSAPPIENRYALGNAWFVGEVKSVSTANDEILAVGKIDPARTAVVHDEFREKLSGFTPKAVDGTIKLTSYKPNHLVYESNAQSEQLAVFSEVYYPSGWNVLIDGKPADHFRADYVLRAMRVPAGKHVIEFKFEPSSYKTGETISLASSVILILLVLGIAFTEIRKRQTVK
jgi:hypothetical protein